MFVKAMRLAAILSLGACASITAGTTQSVNVNSSPKNGASCQLTNEKGTWNVPSTPGATTVNKAHGPLTAACKTDDGWAGSATIESTTAAASFGNIIAGGIVGAAVDMGTGAAYLYPAEIHVPLSQQAGSVGEAPLIKCQVKRAELLTDAESCRKAGGEPKIAQSNGDSPKKG